MLGRILSPALFSLLVLWTFSNFAHSQGGSIEINISEAITVTDTVTTLPSVMINVSEPLTVSDAVSVDPLPVVEINISETITVADSVNTLPSVLISISEAVGVSDSVGTQPSVWIEIAEPVTVSDAVSVDPLPVVQINISESITVTDTITTLPSVMINISESVGVSDTVDTQTSAWIEVTEAVTVTDSINITIYPVVDISISETVSVIDSIDLLPSVMISVSEPVSVMDSITIRSSVMISVSESVTVSDTVIADAFFSPIASAGDPYTGVEGLPLILDGSGSIDPDGSIVLYEWDIDDDGAYEYSSSSPMQSHLYSYESIYTIRLRVTDDDGLTGEAITYAYVLDSSPTADFISFPTGGTPPLAVYFTNYSDGYDQPLSYEWDFENDGTIDSTLSDPWHEYPLGIYSVKLTVTDSDGSTSTLLRTNYISSCLSPVRIAGTPPWYYTTIQSAYDEAYEGEVIQSRDQVFTEYFFIDRNLHVYFEGGFNCGYSTNEGVTVINGNVTLTDGMFIIDSGTLQIR